MHILTLDWSNATPLDYGEAVERLFSEFGADPVDVSIWRPDGGLEVTFVGRLQRASAYDEGAETEAFSVAVELDAGTVVIDRKSFENAGWLEQDSALRGTQRALRFTTAGREIEFQ